MAADLLCSSRRTVVESCCMCGLILLLVNGIHSWQVTPEMVKEWANAIGDGTYNFTSRITGAPVLQEEYKKFKTRRIDGTDLLQQTKRRMDNFFDSKLKALESLAKKAEEAYHLFHQNETIDRKMTSYSYHNMKNINESLLKYYQEFDTNVNPGFSGIHIPTDVYNETPIVVNGIRWTEALDEVFVKNYEKDPSLTWQYYGSQDGFYRMYPAKKWVVDHPKNVDMFDARRRGWYIQGASSPKNVIIVIDASGSMHGVPMKIAKLSAQTVIDILEEDDFFNVVHFNSEPYVLLCGKQSNSSQLIQATKRNREYAKTMINSIKDTNVAKWSLAMKTAFQLLETAKANQKGAECQQIIVVFSDGTNEDLQDTFDEHNKDKKVRVFTYPVGPPAESTKALHRMACDNKGYFWRIQSVGVVREAITETYVKVLSRPMAQTTSKSAWTSLYIDALGLGLMISGVLPVFRRTNNTAIKNCLLGVLGTDVALRDLHRLLYQPLIGANGYAFGINNNGQVMLHPRLKSAFGYLQDPAGVDLLEVEFPLVEDQSKLEKLRDAMINKSRGEVTFWVHDVSRDELRVIEREMKCYYSGIDNTPFGFGIATPRLGFKYIDFNGTKEERVNKLETWLNDAGSISDIENWPYCESVILSNDPTGELEEQLKKPSDKRKCSDDMLDGLWVDIEATAPLETYWDSTKDTYKSEKIKAVFVRTHFGLKKVSKHSERMNATKLVDTYPSQSDFFGRVVSGSSNNSVTYAAPYRKGNQGDANTFIAYQQVSEAAGLPAAVVGYEMDMDNFVKKFVNATVQCKSRHCNADVNCDRKGKNSAEGYYCYLLDENAFVVASNTEESIGKFFGEVSTSIMDALLFRNKTKTPTSLYHKFQFRDLQATCKVKSPASGGTSILRPLFSVKSYFEWWTTKAAWSLLYFNVYNWLFSSTGSVAEGSGVDIVKNESCVKLVTSYYAEKKDVLIKGSPKCSECTTDFVVSSVRHSNLYLLVAEPSCVNCKEGSVTVEMPGGSKQLDPYEVQQGREKETCVEPRYRKIPGKCFSTDKGDSENGYMCGSTNAVRASCSVIFQLLAVYLLAQRTVIRN